MKNTFNVLRAGVLVALLCLGPSVASATFFLDFEGLGDQEAVNHFYNGGLGGFGSGPGPNDGVVFTSNSLAIVSMLAGGSGNFMNEPSPNTVLFWTEGPAATMNVAAGFTTGLSFYYTAHDLAGYVGVYDGLNGTGNQLALIPLPALGGDPNLPYVNNRWAPAGIGFAGIARSVDFAGTANYIGFDNVTFGGPTPQSPVPEPAAALLLCMGLIAAGGAARLRRRGPPSA